jgi:hypothetical protein
MVVVGKYAYVAANESLRILDVSEPAAPIEVGTYRIIGLVDDIAIDGNTLYTATDRGMRITDVTVRTEPTVVGAYQDDLFALRGKVIIAGSYAYLITTDGTRIIDISKPTAPRLVSIYVGGTYVVDIVVEGHFAYLARANCGINPDCEGGLQVVDVSNPSAPIQVENYPLPGGAYSVAVRGSRLYIGVLNGIKVLDISDPMHPTSVSDISLAATPHDLLAIGDRLFASDPGTVSILDVADPTDAHILDSYNASDSINEIAFADNILYVGTSSGLHILNIFDPTHIVESAYFQTQREVLGLAASDGLIYTGTYHGLYVLHYQGPSIIGQVIRPNGQPVPGTNITSSIGVSTTSDATGIFTFTGVLSTTVVLTATLGDVLFSPPELTITQPFERNTQNFVALGIPATSVVKPELSAHLPFTDTQNLVSELEVPAGAITRTTTLSITPTLATSNGGVAFAGHAFSLSATYNGAEVPEFATTKPMTVTIRYSDEDISVVSDESGLLLKVWTAKGWQAAGQTCAAPVPERRTPALNQVTAEICRGGTFALFGPTHQLYLPVVGSPDP